SEVFRHSTIRAMAERVQQLRGQTSLGTIDPAAAVESMPASSVQARMFLLQQMEPGSTTYNVASLFEVRPGVTREAVTAALGAIARRYDAFRCAFYLDGDVVRMRVAPDIELAVPEVATTEAERESAVEALVQPFELGEAPLARAAWVTTER